MQDLTLGKRCTKCILPESYPLIRFDEDGVCNYCREHKEIEYLGEKPLLELLNKIKGKGYEYDCLVPVSGGRDSAYVLYQMKKVYKMSVLAYNYDNGFVSSIAKENLIRMSETLGVELITLKSKRDIQCRNLRHVIKLNLNKSLQHVQRCLCEGCNFGIWGGAYKVASQKGVPLIIFGESKMESGLAKKILGKALAPSRKDKIIYMIKMPVNFALRRYNSYLLEKEFPLKKFEHKENIRKINFFNYVKWDEYEIINTIKDVIGWHYEKNQSSWRFDCKIHALVNHMHRNIYGFTEKDELYSKMVREGVISREMAMNLVIPSKIGIEKEIETAKQVLNKLGLTIKEQSAMLQY